MNDMTKVGLPSLTMDEATLITVLENSLYPGAQPSSIALVVNYCRAAGLDPMMKPVHIVPMWDSKASRMRDVIMPGVGLYRTQAARSGQYAGVTEPEFGPDVTEKIGGVEITYPAWCRVTAKRAMSNGAIAEFSAVERWKENYAVKGGKEKSIAPNSMWMRRPYAQLAKCASAQALRIAFPELTGAQPTADEMEGKHLDDDVIESTAKREPETKTLPEYAADAFSKNLTAWTKLIESGKKSAKAIINTISTVGVLSDEQKATLNAIKIKDDTGETELLLVPATLLEQVMAVCANACAARDRDTAFAMLDDARIILPEMNADNKALAVVEIDAAMAAIKGRK